MDYLNLQYLEYLKSSWQKLLELPPLSISEINDNINIKSFQIIFKIIYNHVEISADALSAEEISEITGFKSSPTQSNILLLVSWLGQTSNFDRLLQMGFDKNYVNKRGANALLYATGGNIPMLDHLLSLGFDRNFVDRYGANALHYASGRGQIPMVNHLLSLGFDRNSVDRYGANALHYASANGQILMVNHLLSLGLDKNSVNNHGDNALYYSTKRHRVELTMHLLRLGCSLKGVDTQSETFKTAQSRVARSRANFTIFRALVKLMMGVIRHRYWSPEGEGYHYAFRSFANKI